MLSRQVTGEMLVAARLARRAAASGRSYTSGIFRIWNNERSYRNYKGPLSAGTNRFFSSPVDAHDSKNIGQNQGDATPVLNPTQNTNVRVSFLIPSNKAGSVVGPQGSVILSIEKETSTTIFVGKAGTASSETVPVTISGTADATAAARERIERLLRDDSNTGVARKGEGAQGGREQLHQEEIKIAWADAGHLVGKNGVKIHALMKETVSPFPTGSAMKAQSSGRKHSIPELTLRFSRAPCIGTAHPPPSYNHHRE